MQRHFKNIREECAYFGVRMQTIAEDLKYTQPYVSAVLCGKRQNSAIYSLATELLTNRKKELKELLNDNIRSTRQEPKKNRNWDQ